MVSVLASKVAESPVQIGDEFSMVAMASLARQTESPESVVLVKALASKMKHEYTTNKKDLPKRIGGLAEAWLSKYEEGKDLLAVAARNNELKKALAQNGGRPHF